MKPYNERTRVGKFLFNLVGGMTAFLKKNKAIAVRAVAAINAAVQSDVSKAVVKFIPGEWDDRVHEALTKVLPKLVVGMAFFDRVLDLPADEILRLLVIEIKKMPLGQQGEAYKRLAAALYTALQDGKVSEKEAVNITQETYRFLKDAGYIH